MSGEANFRKTRLSPRTTNEFVFHLSSTSSSHLKPNAKQRYPCEFCDLQLFCKTSLSQHLLTHKIDSLCKSEKEIHLKNTKRLENLFTCKECNFAFSQKSSFQKHCTIHKRRTFVCKICNESFPFMNYLQRHCLLKHLDKCIDVESLESLMISEEPFLSDEKLVKNTDVHKFSLTHTNQNQFVRNVCNKIFICKDTTLAKSLKDTVEGKDFKHKTKCNDLKGTTQGKNLKDAAGGAHLKPKTRCKDVKNMSGNNEFKGKTGNKDLTKTVGCKDKLKSRKTKAPIEDFTCDVCNKIYKLKIAFMSHQMSHVAVKPTCEVCHKQFASNKSLKLHFRTHSDERIFFCELCNKGFKHKHHLRAHFITHTDEVPFVCEICNKGFKYKWGLKQHEVVHAKDLFVCEVCGKGFEQGCDLDKHFSYHEKESEGKGCGQGIMLLNVKDEPNKDTVNL